MTIPYRDYTFHQRYQMVANSSMVDTDRHNYPLQSFQSAGIKTQSMPQSVLCLLSLGVSTLPTTSLAGNSGSISTARRLCAEELAALALFNLRRSVGSRHHTPQNSNSAQVLAKVREVYLLHGKLSKCRETWRACCQHPCQQSYEERVLNQF